MGTTGRLPEATSVTGWGIFGRRTWRLLPAAGAIVLGVLAAAPAQALPGTLSILPTFDPSITDAGNAAAIKGAINSAIGTIEGLYTTFKPVTDNVYFTLGASSFPATVLNGVAAQSYGAYTSALTADSVANPANKVLATAIANLSKGNNADGKGDILGTSGHLRSLGFDAPPCFNASGGFSCGASDHPFDAIVTLNNDLLAFTRPPPAFPPKKFDALGVIEHQLNEVLGGGSTGSNLNNIAGCPDSGSFFCGKFGPLDLYRYDKDGKPSFTTDPDATSFFSVDGGATDIVGFNQNPAGAFGDFGPNTSICPDNSPGGPGALIQNAFPCSNQEFENYTTTSPEYPMMLSIGYDPTGVVPPPLPEPGGLALFATALFGLGVLRRHRR